MPRDANLKSRSSRGDSSLDGSEGELVRLTGGQLPHLLERASQIQGEDPLGITRALSSLPVQVFPYLHSAFPKT